MPVLMALTILAIAGFQLYWLKKAYDREQRTLEMRSNMAFRETIFGLQTSKLKIDTLGFDSSAGLNKMTREPARIKSSYDRKMVSMVNMLREKVRYKDSTENVKERTIMFSKPLPFDTSRRSKPNMRERNRIIQFLYDMESLQDTIKVKEIKVAFATRMAQQNMSVPFSVTRLQKIKEDEERVYNEVTIGFRNPITYHLQIGNTFPYIIKRISAPILLSLFLVAFTLVSFLLLYSNVLKQSRLAAIKNEFISNITHELKTPIATVSVAIEALRSFNATMDPQKTKEYLDISALELQRLSMLVDKVLKLSMFENKEIELKYETLDMKGLVDEVTTSMRLQFEKYNAIVHVETTADTTVQGDRLHLVSVIFNLVDNALKYSTASPQLDISIKGNDSVLTLVVADKGIGIPPEYKQKVFEKFFRVPTGNVHNAKGYGLGLSYAAHVIEKHNGTIRVESGAEESGSKFIVTIPKHQA